MGRVGQRVVKKEDAKHFHLDLVSSMFFKYVVIESRKSRILMKKVRNTKKYGLFFIFREISHTKSWKPGRLVHNFNLRTWEGEADKLLRWKPVWCTEKVCALAGLHKRNPILKNKNSNNKKYLKQYL